MQFIQASVQTEDHHRISFDHFRNGHDQVVIIAHGFFNSRRALLLRELGHAFLPHFDVIIMDFRGHGDSEGWFSWTSKEYLDLLAVAGYAHNYYSRIGVVGFSLGAVTGIVAASKTNLINSLVAVSPATECGRIEYHFWRLELDNDIFYNLKEGKIGKGVRPGPFWLRKEKPIELIEKLRVPILFLHGDQDWVIRHDHSTKLYERAKGRKRLHIVSKGPHAEYLIRKHKMEIFREMNTWFKETLRGSL